MAGPAGLRNTSCISPYGPCSARSKLLPTILYFGLLSFALWAVLRTFKIAPGNFVEPITVRILPSYFHNLTTFVRLCLLNMAGPAGFEPTHARIKTWCLTAWRRPNCKFSNFCKTLTPAKHKHMFGRITPGFLPYALRAISKRR
jgi:hypothetical protein